MPRLPSPLVSPILRSDLQTYPVVTQLIRVTATVISGPTGVSQIAASSVLAPVLYVSFTQQVRDDGSLLPRDREPCLVADMNGLGLTPGFYLGRLAGTWTSLPVYEVGGAGGVSVGPAGSYSTNVGDGSNTTYTITHNLNTRDVVVQVYETTGSYNKVDPTIGATTPNTVTVTFASAPTSNQYRTVVSKGGIATAGGNVIGPGSSTDTAIALWSGSGGIVLRDSVVKVDASGNVTGPSGGFTITGGIGSGDNLVLKGTSHTTQGTVDTLARSGDTSNVRDVLRVRHTTTNTATTGIGTGILYTIQNNPGTETNAGRISALWTTATGGSEAADFVFTLMKAGALTEAARMMSTGGIRLPEVTTPSAQPAGYGQIYFKHVGSYGQLFWVDSGGVEFSAGWTTGSFTAAGSTQGTATTITANGATVTGADGTKGVIMRSGNSPCVVYNNAASSLQVYPPSGAKMGTVGATDAPVSVGAGLVYEFFEVSSTLWCYTSAIS